MAVVDRPSMTAADGQATSTPAVAASPDRHGQAGKGSQVGKQGHANQDCDQDEMDERGQANHENDQDEMDERGQANQECEQSEAGEHSRTSQHRQASEHRQANHVGEQGRSEEADK
jgi:hypothetical protein